MDLRYIDPQARVLNYCYVIKAIINQCRHISHWWKGGEILQGPQMKGPQSVHVTWRVDSWSNKVTIKFSWCERERENEKESRIEKDKGAQLLCPLHSILLTFIAGNSSLEPSLEGLFEVAQIHIDLSWQVFDQNRTGDMRITQIC